MKLNTFHSVYRPINASLHEWIKAIYEGPAHPGAQNLIVPGSNVEVEFKSLEFETRKPIMGCYLWSHMLLKQYSGGNTLFVCVGASADWPSQCMRAIPGPHSGNIVNVPISGLKEAVEANMKQHQINQASGEQQVAASPKLRFYVADLLPLNAQNYGTIVILDSTSSGAALNVMGHLVRHAVGGGPNIVKISINHTPITPTGTTAQLELIRVFMAALPTNDGWKNVYGRAIERMDVHNIERKIGPNNNFTQRFLKVSPYVKVMRRTAERLNGRFQLTLRPFSELKWEELFARAWSM